MKKANLDGDALEGYAELEKAMAGIVEDAD
jgi:hypothetical protein